MPIYHLSAKVIGRSAGRTATASAAYRSGERIADERTGEIFDYSRKRNIEHCEIIAPDNAPAWMHDRAQLWNAVERVEARKDAQLCREVEVALPRELSPAARLELIREFTRSEFVDRGMVADISIHNPQDRDGSEKPHAHVLLTMRELLGDGFGNKARDWNDKAVLERWRENWADYANRALERAGIDERIDHRSYEDQGIDREPQPKLGGAAALERRGIQTERGDELRAVQARNALRDRLRRILERFTDRADILLGRGAATVREKALSAKERIDALFGRGNATTEKPDAPDRDR